MAQITITIDGIRPLMTHNPQSMFGKKGARGATEIPTPEDEAELGTYRLPDGTCALRSESLPRAMHQASGAWKIKRSSMKAIIAHIEAQGDLVPLTTHDGKPISSFAVDVRSVVLKPAGRILRARPRFDEWSAAFLIEYDETLIPDQQLLLNIAADAGRRFGVGDYRPRFGRFTVRA